MTFDPDGPGDGEGLYGLAPSENPSICVIGVPWEATASYGRGTSSAPETVAKASWQVDLEDLEYGPVWREGIDWFSLPIDVRELNRQACELAMPIIAAGGVQLGHDAASKVDALATQRDDAVYQAASTIFESGAIPVVLGGDHSSPYGLIAAASERHEDFGILHIDAHADLRVAYLGFQSSHASIMHRVLHLPRVKRIVGVGYRDLGLGEVHRIKNEPERLCVFPDHQIGMRLAGGEPWNSIVDSIVDRLPQQVHISFDIDGLDPSLCPNTGTPVPGGLRYREVLVLLRRLSEHRSIVSFDLCEVAPGSEGEWDSNVGARLLYKLAGCALESKRKHVTPGAKPSV